MEENGEWKEKQKGMQEEGREERAYLICDEDAREPRGQTAHIQGGEENDFNMKNFLCLYAFARL